MELFSLFSPILVAAALFSYLNHRVMKLPTTIGVMLIALVMSLGLILLHFLGVELQEPAVDFLEKLRFREALGTPGPNGSAPSFSLPSPRHLVLTIPRL